jgi:hypothetical protein
MQNHPPPTLYLTSDVLPKAPRVIETSADDPSLCRRVDSRRGSWKDEADDATSERFSSKEIVSCHFCTWLRNLFVVFT